MSYDFLMFFFAFVSALAINRLKTTLSKSDNKSYITPYLIIMCLQEPEHHQQLIQHEWANCRNDWKTSFDFYPRTLPPALMNLHWNYNLNKTCSWKRTTTINVGKHVNCKYIYIYISLYKEVILLLLHLNQWSLSNIHEIRSYR
jgi:hypothetical protein